MRDIFPITKLLQFIGMLFRNYLNTDEDVKGFPDYIKALAKISRGGKTCGICNSDYELPDNVIVELKGKS